MTDWERTMCTWFIDNEYAEDEVEWAMIPADMISSELAEDRTPARAPVKPVDAVSWHEGHQAGVRAAARSLMDYLDGKDAVATEQAVWEWLRDHDVASAIIKEVWRHQ